MTAIYSDFLNPISKVLLRRFIFLCMITLTQPVSRVDANDWTVSSGNYEAHRSFESTSIRPDTVDSLVKAWSFKSDDHLPRNTIQTSPLITRECVIFPSLNGILRCLDPSTGKQRWSSQLPIPLARRGMSILNQSTLLLAANKFLIAIDLTNGSTISQIETGTSLLKPIIINNDVVIATLLEGVKRYSLDNGQLVWHQALSRQGKTPRLWSGISMDPDNELILVTTSNPGGVTGIDREPDDLSSSVVAIDSMTGSIRWHYKHIFNDLWDYDVLADPIVLRDDSPENNKVIALTKTGDIIFLNSRTGSEVFPSGSKMKTVASGDVTGVDYARRQREYSLPNPLIDIFFDPTDSFEHLDNENKKYVEHKVRNAKFGKYSPPSLDHDVVLYGIHGGAEWPGGSLTQINGQPAVIVQANKTPWIIRLQNQETPFIQINETYLDWAKTIGNFIKSEVPWFTEWARSIYSILTTGDVKDTKEITPKTNEENHFSRWTPSNWESEPFAVKLAYRLTGNKSLDAAYYQQCASCHGIARQGRHQSESWGDGYVPSLVDISASTKASMQDPDRLARVHCDAGHCITAPEASVLDAIAASFEQRDRDLEADGEITIEGFWQYLLDAESKPASSPPWGFLVATDLTTGQQTWKVPMGISLDKQIEGDIAFGGILTTTSGVTFATGTPAPYLYAYETKSGELLSKYRLAHSGSSPPAGFSRNGCDYIVQIASGGRFVNYPVNRGLEVSAWTTKECKDLTQN